MGDRKVDGQRRRVALPVLLVGTIVYLASLPFAIIGTIVSPLAFRAGPSPWAYAALVGAVSYCVLAVLAILAAWTLYSGGRHRAGMAVLLAPLLGTPLAAAAAALLCRHW